jgi:N-methylhydantoinase A/acetophenone carboxylase
MDVLHVYERSRRFTLLSPGKKAWLDDYEGFNGIVEQLKELALRDFAGEGFDTTDISYELELDMKFGGQLNVKRATSPVLRVNSKDDVIKTREAFEREYAEAYSPLGLNPQAGIEIHNFVIRGRVAQPKPEVPRFEAGGPDASPARIGSRQAYWGPEIGWAETPVYGQDRLKAGNVLEGPAIVEAEDTTIVVEPNWKFSIGEYMDGILEFTGKRDDGSSQDVPATHGV